MVHENRSDAMSANALVHRYLHDAEVTHHHAKAHGRRCDYLSKRIDHLIQQYQRASYDRRAAGIVPVSMERISASSPNKENHSFTQSRWDEDVSHQSTGNALGINRVSPKGLDPSRACQASNSHVSPLTEARGPAAGVVRREAPSSSSSSSSRSISGYPHQRQASEESISVEDENVYALTRASIVISPRIADVSIVNGVGGGGGGGPSNDRAGGDKVSMEPVGSHSSQGSAGNPFVPAIHTSSLGSGSDGAVEVDARLLYSPTNPFASPGRDVASGTASPITTPVLAQDTARRPLPLSVEPKVIRGGGGSSSGSIAGRRGTEPRSRASPSTDHVDSPASVPSPSVPRTHRQVSVEALGSSAGSVDVASTSPRHSNPFDRVDSPNEVPHSPHHTAAAGGRSPDPSADIPAVPTMHQQTAQVSPQGRVHSAIPSSISSTTTKAGESPVQLAANLRAEIARLRSAAATVASPAKAKSPVITEKDASGRTASSPSPPPSHQQDKVMEVENGLSQVRDVDLGLSDGDFANDRSLTRILSQEGDGSPENSRLNMSASPPKRHSVLLRAGIDPSKLRHGSDEDVPTQSSPARGNGEFSGQGEVHKARDAVIARTNDIRVEAEGLVSAQHVRVDSDDHDDPPEPEVSGKDDKTEETEEAPAFTPPPADTRPRRTSDVATATSPEPIVPEHLRPPADTRPRRLSIDASTSPVSFQAIQTTASPVDDPSPVGDKPGLTDKELFNGAVFLKVPYGGGKPKERTVFVSTYDKVIRWGPVEKAPPAHGRRRRSSSIFRSRTIGFEDVQEVSRGKGSEAFSKHANKVIARDDQCLTVRSSKRSLDLVAPTVEQAELWYNALRRLCSYNKS